MKIESSPKRCIIREGEISPKAKKDLNRLPNYLKDKFFIWLELVENEGLEKVRKIRGYRDEALQGKRKGQRSIRLNKGYRIIYKVDNNLIIIEEVNKHDY